MVTKSEEAEILNWIRNKETRKRGFSLLIKAYQERLYWHVRKLVVNHDDSKDVLQEVFLRIWRNMDKFHGDSNLFTWLYRIATNESLRFLEKKRKNQAVKMSMQEMLIKELETAPFISGEEIQMALQKAILGLTDKQRLVFNMRYFDELEYPDIAEILETTVNNVKVLYHYAKSKIEEQIKRQI
jgi:RNA polymerase sigma factor (sigma-70 family)